MPIKPRKTDPPHPLYVLRQRTDPLMAYVEVYELERETEHNYVVKFRSSTRLIPKHKHRLKDLAAPDPCFRTEEDVLKAWNAMMERAIHNAESRLKHLKELVEAPFRQVPYQEE